MLEYNRWKNSLEVQKENGKHHGEIQHKMTQRIQGLIVLPSMEAVDLWDTKYWNLGTLVFNWDSVDPEAPEETENYFKSVQKTIDEINNPEYPSVILEDTTSIIQNLRKDTKRGKSERLLFFAFPGKAEKTANAIRNQSLKTRFWGMLILYDMFLKRFWWQGICEGEWDEGFIDYGGDAYVDEFEKEIPNKIKESFEILKEKGYDYFNKSVHNIQKKMDFKLIKKYGLDNSPYHVPTFLMDRMIMADGKVEKREAFAAKKVFGESDPGFFEDYLSVGEIITREVYVDELPDLIDEAIEWMVGTGEDTEFDYSEENIQLMMSIVASMAVSDGKITLDEAKLLKKCLDRWEGKVGKTNWFTEIHTNLKNAGVEIDSIEDIES